MKLEIAGRTLELARGDITHEHTDAIVNAANSSLLGGGGVDGAIHRAGGPAILDACKRIRAERGSCPTGDAVITTGGNLAARFVIHAVGPIWRGGRDGEPELLAAAYASSLALAEAHGLQSIAFPSISTGAYGYPEPAAAAIALGTVARHLRGDCGLRLVRFVLFGEVTLAHYRVALGALGRSSPSSTGTAP
ncbi:MAG: O-acetyl-ADP-ribose deacetylase [bacterium]